MVFLNERRKTHDPVSDGFVRWNTGIRNRSKLMGSTSYLFLYLGVSSVFASEPLALLPWCFTNEIGSSQ